MKKHYALVAMLVLSACGGNNPQPVPPPPVTTPPPVVTPPPTPEPPPPPVVTQPPEPRTDWQVPSADKVSQFVEALKNGGTIRELNFLIDAADTPQSQALQNVIVKAFTDAGWEDGTLEPLRVNATFGKVTTDSNLAADLMEQVLGLPVERVQHPVENTYYAIVISK